MGIAQNASIMYKRCNHTLFIYWFLILSGRLNLWRTISRNMSWWLTTVKSPEQQFKKVTTTMSAVITTTFMRELVTKVSDHHHWPSSRIAVRCFTNPSPNDQKVSISSTHFTIHHHHHHQHRFSVHQQKFARIVFLARPCMTDCFAHVSVHVIR